MDKQLLLRLDLLTVIILQWQEVPSIVYNVRRYLSQIHILIIILETTEVPYILIIKQAVVYLLNLP